MGMLGRPDRFARTAGLVRGSVGIGAARMTAGVVGLSGHRGTALPGLVGARIWPDALGSLAGQLDATVLVIGTNGKTSTAALIADIVLASGREPIANRSGANMRQGIVSSLLRESDLHGRLRRDRQGRRQAVFEVDEIALEQILPHLGPTMIVATNLFRDQVDRYGEADGVIDRWTSALATAADGTTLIYCADDPRLAMLAAATRLPTITFGLAGPPMDRPPQSQTGSTGTDAVADPVACRACGRQLEYAWRSIGHLGGFACPEGHVSRSQPDIAVDPPVASGSSRRNLDPSTHQATASPSPRLRIGGRFGDALARPLDDGLTGAYNVAAALAGGVALGRSVLEGSEAIEKSAGPFGRFEWLEVDGRHVILALIKNTVSLAESVHAGSTWSADTVLLGLNDAPADGRDVSWIWDAPIAPLVAGRTVVLTGSRSTDLGLRLQYDADLATSPPCSIHHATTLAEALDVALAQTPTGGGLVIAATYTAMMGLRSIVERRGRASPVPR